MKKRMMKTPSVIEATVKTKYRHPILAFLAQQGVTPPVKLQDTKFVEQE